MMNSAPAADMLSSRLICVCRPSRIRAWRRFNHDGTDDEERKEDSSDGLLCEEDCEAARDTPDGAVWVAVAGPKWRLT